MKLFYPIVLTPDKDCYLVYIPDLGIHSRGSDSIQMSIVEAMQCIEEYYLNTDDGTTEFVPPSPAESIVLKENEILKVAECVVIDIPTHKKEIRSGRYRIR